MDTESIRYYLNYDLPEKILYTMDTLNRAFSGYFGFILLSTTIIAIFVALKSAKRSVQYKDDYMAQNRYMQILNSLNSIEALENHILKFGKIIDAQYVSLYEKRGETFILISTNAPHDEENAEVSAPFRIELKTMKPIYKSGNYFVHTIANKNQHYMLRLYSIKEIEIKKITGYADVLLHYYEDKKNLQDVVMDKKNVIAATNISNFVLSEKIGSNGYVRFLLSLIYRVINPQGLKLENQTEIVFSFGEYSDTLKEKIFHIRNTSYKLKIYTKIDIEIIQLQEIGRFLDTAGNFLATISEDSEIAKNYIRFLVTANEALESKNQYYKNHSKMVGIIADTVAKSLFLNQQDIENIALAASIHDIGMVGDIESLLNDKKQDLSSSEMYFIKHHTLIGESLVMPIAHIHPIGAIIKYHHERFDGNGYPQGLRGSEIPITAQILALAEFFSALISPRPNRAAIDFDEAVEMLQEVSNKMFDGVVVNAFLETKGKIKKQLLLIKDKNIGEAYE